MNCFLNELFDRKNQQIIVLGISIFQYLTTFHSLLFMQLSFPRYHTFNKYFCRKLASCVRIVLIVLLYEPIKITRLSSNRLNVYQNNLPFRYLLEKLIYKICFILQIYYARPKQLTFC